MLSIPSKKSPELLLPLLPRALWLRPLRCLPPPPPPPPPPPSPPPGRPCCVRFGPRPGLESSESDGSCAAAFAAPAAAGTLKSRRSSRCGRRYHFSSPSLYHPLRYRVVLEVACSDSLFGGAPPSRSCAAACGTQCVNGFKSSLRLSPGTSASSPYWNFITSLRKPSAIWSTLPWQACLSDG